MSGSPPRTVVALLLLSWVQSLLSEMTHALFKHALASDEEVQPALQGTKTCSYSAIEWVVTELSRLGTFPLQVSGQLADSRRHYISREYPPAPRLSRFYLKRRKEFWTELRGQLQSTALVWRTVILSHYLPT